MSDNHYDILCSRTCYNSDTDSEYGCVVVCILPLAALGPSIPDQREMSAGKDSGYDPRERKRDVTKFQDHADHHTIQ